MGHNSRGTTGDAIADDLVNGTRRAISHSAAVEVAPPVISPKGSGAPIAVIQD